MLTTIPPTGGYSLGISQLSTNPGITIRKRELTTFRRKEVSRRQETVFLTLNTGITRNVRGLPRESERLTGYKPHGKKEIRRV